MPLPSDPIAWAIRQFSDGAQLLHYQIYSDYYRGKTNLEFATAKFEQAFGHLFSALGYNRCASVVDSLADRMHVTGFQDQAGSGNAQPAIDLWQLNRMDAREGEINLEAFTAGDAYAIVWPDQDTGEVTIFPQTASDVRVLYDRDKPGRILLAAKSWRGTADDEDLKGHIFLNLYLPDRLEKYVTTKQYAGTYPSRPQAFARYQPEGDLQWPLMYDWYDSRRANVPVFHFSNNARTGCYGRSELEDVVPLQDALNKSLSDLLVASEFSAYRQKWATGVKGTRDPATGRVSPPWDAGVDRILGAEAADARFGTFDSSDLNQMIATTSAIDLAIARVSRVPVHYLGLSSDFPSGESLKTAEAPFVSKVVDRQIAFGNVWEDVMTLALRMANIDLAFQLETVYRPAEPRTEREMAENGESMKRTGFPLPAIMRMAYKLTEDEIEQVLEESNGEVERARAAFDAGEIGDAGFGVTQDEGAA